VWGLGTRPGLIKMYYFFASKRFRLHVQCAPFLFISYLFLSLLASGNNINRSLFFSHVKCCNAPLG